MLGAGRVSQGLPQQFLVLEDVPDPPFATFHPGGLAVVRLFGGGLRLWR